MVVRRVGAARGERGFGGFAVVLASGLGAFAGFLRALFGFGFALGVLLGNDVGDDLVEPVFVGLQLGEFLAARADVLA